MANPNTDFEIIADDIRRLVKILAIIAEETANAARNHEATPAEIFIGQDVRNKLQEIMHEAEILPKH